MAMGCFDFCRTTARQGQRLKCSIHPQTLERKGNEDVWCKRVACTSCLNLRFKSLVDYNDVLEDLNFSFVSKLKNFFSKSEKVEMDNIYSSLSPSFVLKSLSISYWLGLLSHVTASQTAHEYIAQLTIRTTLDKGMEIKAERFGGKQKIF